MNNQMPYFNDMNQGNMHPGFNPNHMQGNFNEMMFERLNNKITRLERQVRILENRLNKLESGKPTFLKNNLDDNDNMYML